MGSRRFHRYRYALYFPSCEKELGSDIILTNKTGGVGAIATKYVNAKKADGYTLLMGAENPQMYKSAWVIRYRL